MPDTIMEFTYKDGRNRTVHTFLSNFFIEPDGTCVEAEYQAAKTDDLSSKFNILLADPGTAKQLGRATLMRPWFEDRKLDIMLDLVFGKFTDHFDLAKQLIDTGDALLVEGNWWHDNFWGACQCSRCKPKTHVNFNNLGRILMRVRAFLQEDQV